ncbi:MAG: ClpXP protease specificity-enhancing factor SspB [Pseudomonadota bacterium]
MASSDGINYGRIMERALRTVVADVLGLVAENGLTGEHHFYITFDTTHPGVDIPDILHEAYPSEMMIVLQEWFEGLAVMGDRFTVTLNFSNMPQTLVVPFAAVKTFIDPSVKFGLKFDDMDEDDTPTIAEVGAPESDIPMPDDKDTAASSGTAAKEDDGDGDGDGDGPRGEVVSLDSFRKG